MNTYAEALEQGLSTSPKAIPTRFIYDDRGSQIFQQIMNMPEYYLTDCELEIFQTQSNDIYKHLNFDRPFNIIELGAGDGLKTKELLSALLSQNLDFTFIPVDISDEAIQSLTKRLSLELPNLKMNPKVGDYFKVLEEVIIPERPNLFLFLGSNIGNYEHANAVELLRHFGEHMLPNDKLLIGFDLKKNPETIRLAYQDPHGITKAFNMNLLERANRELGADFELEQFDFYCFYNPYTGAVRSMLVSLEQQQVQIQALNQSYSFGKNEIIRTELSQKYDLDMIQELATETGYQPVHHFMDGRSYFSDSLWVKSGS